MIQNKSINVLLNQVIHSITEKDIEKMIKQEACMDGPPSTCINPQPKPRPLRMIAYDDMVKDAGK
ncbi:hypothetical protein [Acinetobacter oleivorans]|uniref:hypothetical protein n=1 Tax=Acinetobacter oleivorans TaxID=1148157 RepID=UPI003F5895F6